MISTLTPALPSQGTLAWPATGMIHVWFADLPQFQHAAQHYNSLLAQDERRRADRFVFDKDRYHFILRRGLLRWLLAAYLDVESQRLLFHRGDKGKPVLITPSTSLRFNLSHSDGTVVYAFTQHREIGVDIEKINPLFPCMQVAHQFFTPRETHLLAGLSDAERPATFVQWWTRKEAYLKAIGLGLSELLHEVDVSAFPGDAWSPLSSGWVCRDLALPPGFLGAIVLADRS